MQSQSPIKKGDFLTISDIQTNLSQQNTEIIPEEESVSQNQSLQSSIQNSALTYSQTIGNHTRFMEQIQEVSESQQSLFSQLQEPLGLHQENEELHRKLQSSTEESDKLKVIIQDQFQIIKQQSEQITILKQQSNPKLLKIIEEQSEQIKQLHKINSQVYQLSQYEKIRLKQQQIWQSESEIQQLYMEMDLSSKSQRSKTRSNHESVNSLKQHQ